jgi:hypothetical protein
VVFSASVIFDLLRCVPLSATDVRYRVIIIIIIIINFITFVLLNILMFCFDFCIPSLMKQAVIILSIRN